MNALPLEGEGIPDEIREEIPRLTEPEILRCIGIFCHEYVARFGGSPESVLSVVREAAAGVETGYGEAIEKDRREPEDG